MFGPVGCGVEGDAHGYGYVVRVIVEERGF